MRSDDALPTGETRDLARSLDDLRTIAGAFTGNLAQATREMRDMDKEARRLSRSLGSSLRSAFDKAVFGGESFGEVMRDLARSVAGKALTSALRPVQNAIGRGITGAAGTLGAALAGAVGFERGGAFSAGRVRAFASGGIVSEPVAFPMRGGAGLMGEAGPEAIMPLSRGADGRLGVRAEGRAPAPRVSVTITTPDIESFRRSRGQVAAEIARAVGRGRGRL